MYEGCLLSFAYGNKTTRTYKHARSLSDNTWFEDQLPACRPYSRQLLRLVIVIKKKATNRIHILLGEKTAWHLPSCEIHPAKSLHSTLRRFMIDLFGAEVPPHRPCGILSVEHDASTGKDGVCLTLLVAFRVPLEEVPIIGKCVWHEITKGLGDKLLQRVSLKNSTIPLHVVR
ncbi:unnamed protein product [Acanthoscelides obtectus]|uniref:Uncharacterized protein n=1 Tax=Acanthoscelides obtectus TaxID=200917 RepID=A0A9P0LQD8_ACAOB|nr:unnamed protein product [Acanthoscelides obtectus]CAK1634959.1 hypothetical protein AOBTE_LOCUS8977 [Acanthoscelides obtectus]